MSKSYKILGVDPGTNMLGYAIIKVDDTQLSVPSIGVINLKKYEDHQTKLKEIYLQLQEIIETFLPTYLAVEAPFYGKNVQSMLKLGRAQGVAMAAAITMGLNIQEYAPKRIKQAVTGNGNASKEQVMAMLSQILRIRLDQYPLDATDALGAAYTHYHTILSPFGQLKKYKDWGSFIKNNPSKLAQ